MNNEPLITVASLVAIATAAVGLLVAFGVDLDENQQKAILGFVAVLAPLAVAVLTRSKVYSQDTVDAIRRGEE